MFIDLEPNEHSGAVRTGGMRLDEYLAKLGSARPNRVGLALCIVL
jgi:hypothetical protein